jgi:hypothetical protein
MVAYWEEKSLESDPVCCWQRVRESASARRSSTGNYSNPETRVLTNAVPWNERHRATIFCETVSCKNKLFVLFTFFFGANFNCLC